MRKIKKVYICSPFSGDVENNIRKAREYCRYAIEQGCLPIAPHLLYPQMLDDSKPQERELGIKMGLEILDICDEIWVCGERISDGMSREIERVEKTGKVIVYMTVQEQGMQMAVM